MKQVRVGMVGLGTIHAIHAEAFKPDTDKDTAGNETATANSPRYDIREDPLGKIAAVFDIDPAKSSKRALEFNCTAHSSYESMINDPDIDAVDITLPHALHYEFVRNALDSGKHVLVEKPMAPLASQCRELIEKAQQNGLIFTVAENTRFVHAYQEVKRLLDDEIIGTPRLIRTFISGSEVTRLRDTSLWKGRIDGTVGGAIMDAGPHSFYLLKWLFGNVGELRASASRLVNESEVEDHALVAGALESGTLFSCEFTFTAEMPWNERLEVHGSKGTIVVDQLSDPPIVIYKGELDFYGTAHKAVPHDPVWWKGSSIVAGVNDFLDAVSRNRPTTVDPRDGCYAIEIVEAAYRSCSNNGQVIVLS